MKVAVPFDNDNILHKFGMATAFEIYEVEQGKLKDMDVNAFCKAGCELVYERIREFMGDAPQSDDITMMWVTYTGGRGLG